MENQDWEYRVIEKRVNPHNKQAVQQAVRNGQDIDAVKKKDHTNKATLDARKVATMLNDEDTFTVPTISHDFKIALQQARNAKGLTQEKLAMLVNEKKTVIQDYENGKAVPSNAIIFKLERALDTKLPRIKKPKKKGSAQEDD